MIVRFQVEQVAKSALSGISLLKSLKKLNIDVLEFFKHLESTPDDKELINSVYIIEAESYLRDSIRRIENADDKLSLDKAIAINRAAQWMTEKLIPKTYGVKQEINVSHTIDIKGILARSDSRLSIDAIETVCKDVDGLVNTPRLNTPLADQLEPPISASELLDGEV